MRILLVEDNLGEQTLIKEAFAEVDIKNDLDIVKDGMEAMRFLNREDEYQGAFRPSLIILDLNLPKKDGREVLADIKGNPQLKTIPVLILSNSSSLKDIGECYNLNANVYVGKPSEYEGFLHFAHMIKEFWIKRVFYCPA